MRVTGDQIVPGLLYMSTTESLIPWEWISESRNDELYMTEVERAETLLRVANGESLKVWEWHKLCGARLDMGALRVANQAAWDDLSIPLVDETRLSLRTALDAALRDPYDAVREIEKNAAKITSGRVLTITEISEQGVPRDRVIAHGIGPALIFALCLILDPEKPFRRKLRQCELPACARYEFGNPPQTRGQPPNFYCSDEHRLTHNRQQSNERKAAQRAGLSVSKFRKRKARSAKS